MNSMKETVIDEIALSGLQGLTITDLWQCLMKTEPPLLNTGSDEELKNFLWGCILQCEEIGFFWHNAEKPEVGPEKKKKKRRSQDNANAVKGDPNDSCGGAKLPKDWISDPDNDICGFCPGYYSREDITDEVKQGCMNHLDVYAKWQDNFFVVASQDLRRSALYGEETPSDINMTDLRFIYLEIVGLERRRGFFQKDFKHYAMDARSAFHQVKILSQQGLVTRQKFQMRGDHDGNIQTNILFLTRFHKALSSDSELYSAKICEILSQEPGCVIELQRLRKLVGCQTKLFKRIRQQLYMNGNIQYIQNDQLFNCSNGKTPLARKIVSSQPILVQLIKGYKEGDADVDDDDDEGNYVLKCKETNPQIVNEIHLNQQMYWLVESSRERGMTVHEFGAMSCMPYHMVRSFSRQFDRKNCAKVLITDKARQKVHTILAAKYLHQSEVVKQINKEFDRAEDLANNTFEADDSRDSTQLSAGKDIDTEDTSPEIKIEDKGNKQFIKNLELRHVNEKKNETVRGMKRRNIILEKVKELKIIEGSNSIYKAVSQIEQQQGIKERVCRKSIHRILNRMVEEDSIKRYEIVIKNSESKATVIYYCDPSVRMEDDDFQTAVNETKFRLKGIVSRREIKEGKGRENFLKKERDGQSLLDYVGVSQESPPTESDTDDEDYEPVHGTSYQRMQYGYLPRFPRMKMLQLYLWQLVYGNRADAERCQNEHDHEIKSDSHYDEKNDWRFDKYDWLTELTELPANRQGAGYFQTGDALAIMPVIVFTKCVGICLKSKTLGNMLNDPKKRFTPLRDLPPKLKAKLFTSRNVGVYVGHFIDALVLLTHLGLLYITPERIPSNRTQIVMFVSKEAMLVDTTQSEKGYCKTTLPADMKSFPKLYYRFENLASIQKYWKDVQYVCLNTRLGLVVAPKKEDEENVKKSRPARTLMTLRQFQEHFPIEQAEKAKSRLYGDGLGAGGFDSTFFGHLAKNWTYPGAKNRVLSRPDDLEVDSDSPSALPNRFSMPVGGLKKVVRSSVAVKASVGGRGKKRTRAFDNKIVAEATATKKAKPEATTSPADLKLKKIMAARYRQRLVEAKPRVNRNTSHRPEKDAVDLEAKKRMKAYRVNFSPAEDAAILMIRITAQLLNFEKRKLGYWTLARDILHTDIPEAHDKTVDSLARRGRNILKNSLTVENMKSCVLECRADKNLDTKPPGVEDDKWKTKFKELYAKVKEKYKTKLEPDDFCFEIPDTLAELKNSFNINKAFEQKNAKQFETRTLNSCKDIDILVLEELIHNSLAGQNTKEYMPSLVFRIFDRYPASYLEKALFSMKAKSLVAKLRVQVPRRRALPISTMSYCLSMVYERLFEMPLSPNLFPASKSFLKMIREGNEHGERSDPHRKEASVKENDVEATKEHTNSKSSVIKATELLQTIGCLNSANRPGTITYARDEALGGHIACMLSLLTNDKAILQIDIPDNVVQCDPETIEKLEKSNEVFSSRTITLMKRKMYASSLEDALEKEEDEAMEDIDEVEDRAMEDSDKEGSEVKEDVDEGNGKVMKDGSKGKGKGAIASEKGKGKKHKVKSSMQTEGSAKDVEGGNRKSANNEEDSSNAKASSSKVEKSSLKLRKGFHFDKTSGAVAAVSTKSKKTGTRVKDVDLGGAFGFQDENTKQGTKPSFETEAGNQGEADDVEATRSSEKAGSKRKRKIDQKDEDETVSSKKQEIKSGAINFRAEGSLVTTSFFSNKSLIDKNLDSYTDRSKLKSDFVYFSSSREGPGAGRPGMDVVPSKGFGVTKSKLYASRTTLMIHRTFANEGAFLNTKNLTAFEALNINPLEVTCHLQARPFHDDFDLAQGCVVDACPADQSMESMADRFREAEDTLHTEREIDFGLDCLSDEEFTSVMVERFNWNENETAFAREVLAGLRERRDLGLTEAEIQTIYEKYKSLRSMDELLVMLVNFRVAYCVGMYTTRYVSPAYVRSWSINAPLSKGDEEEIIDVIAKNQIEAHNKKQNEARRKDDSESSNVDSETGKETGSDVQTNADVPIDLPDSMKSFKSLVHISKCEGATTSRINKKPVATIVKVNKKVAETAGSDAQRLPMIGFEASDSSDAEIIGGGKRKENSTVGHVLGQMSRKTELGFKRATCKPWLKLNCEMNQTLFRKFHRSILSFIMMCPGITESAIHKHFRPILRPIELKDMLRFLVLNGCITEHLSRKKHKTSLFDSVEKRRIIRIVNIACFDVFCETITWTMFEYVALPSDWLSASLRHGYWLIWSKDESGKPTWHRRTDGRSAEIISDINLSRNLTGKLLCPCEFECHTTRTLWI
eukprot:gene4613-5219_t